MENRLSPPELEWIEKPFDGSILVRQFCEKSRDTRPYWHYHPELELVYVNGGSGKRHIGSHLSYFHDGELVLIGSNLPHQGFTNRLTDYRSETVVHMTPDFLGGDFFGIPEMTAIKQLFERSKLGLSFSGKSKNAIGAKIEELPLLSSFEKIVQLLEILQSLATSEECTKLNATGFSLEVHPQDNDRLNVVLNYIRNNFQSHISVREMADLISMTEPSFCRFFKKLTGKTFTRFVNEYRLVHAIKLLTEKEISIAEVCDASGYSNYSHFVKHFKSFTGRSPKKYRMETTAVV